MGSDEGFGMKRVVLSVLTWSILTSAANSQTETSEIPKGRFFFGTSAFMLANLAPDKYPPYFSQLNFGYRLTPQDTLSVEAKTWRYYHPLGIPYGPSQFTAEEAYPGHVREAGVGLAYQRFVWKGAYTSLSMVPFLREYFDSQDKKTGDGFQLFSTLRFGYQWRLMDRVFFEPSVAFTHWPVSTNVPAGFEARDQKWPNYFLFEPGFHVGVEF